MIVVSVVLNSGSCYSCRSAESPGDQSRERGICRGSGIGRSAKPQQRPALTRDSGNKGLRHSGISREPR